MNGAPPENPFVLIDITDLADVDEESKYAFSEKRLREILNMLSKSDPRATGLLLSAGEIDNLNETVHHLVQEPIYKGVRFFTNGTIFKDSSLRRLVEFIPEQQRLSLVLSHDSYFDQVSRRIVTYFGIDTTTPNEDSEVIRSFAGKSQKASDFKGSFEYYDSLQVFMKIWPREKWEVQKISSLDDLEKLSQKIKGKALLVGTLWRYSFNASPSIAARTKLFGEANIKKEMTADYELVANYMTNWYSGDYIKTPSPLGEVVWIFAGALAVVGTILFAPVRQALVLSLLTMVGYLFAGLVVFRLGSYEMDSARVVLVGLVSQYFVLPIRFHRVVTRQAKEKYESEARIAEERMKAKTMILAAASDAHMRISAKISHDIRSPLMALRIVGRYLKETLSPDVQQLFEDATKRIDFIAEDTLQKFRKGDDVATFQNASLSEVLTSLISSYEKIRPDVKFDLHIGSEKVPMPDLVLQRCFTNLIQNSIEAVGTTGTPKVSFESYLSDGGVVVTVRDNGPGIPEAIHQNLFKSRFTYGKTGGTGLGLFQVKEELENYGGSIAYEAKGDGACFVVRLPVGLQGLKVRLIGQVVVVGPLEFRQSMLEQLKASGAEGQSFGSFGEAKYFLQNTNGEFTLISDLLLEGYDETAFDLLDSVPSKTFAKILLCTSLLKNEEIYTLAVKRSAVLISRSQLQRVDFSL